LFKYQAFQFFLNILRIKQNANHLDQMLMNEIHFKGDQVQEKVQNKLIVCIMIIIRCISKVIEKKKKEVKRGEGGGGDLNSGLVKTLACWFKKRYKIPILVP
jgi:hypothetical protein